MKKSRKRSLYVVLLLLIAVFLAGVGYVATATWQARSKVWVASVHEKKYVHEKKPDVLPASLPKPLPFPLLPPEEAIRNPLPALLARPPAPRRVRRPSRGQGCIAIVIDDLGLNEASTRRAIALPAAVTLSFLPYGKNLDALTAQAREAGHELLLHVPMEPVGRESPGPDALYVGLSPDEIRARLTQALARFSGYDGVNNHMGSKFTADRAGMETVMSVLRERDLFFLDSYTNGKSIAADVAREGGVPTETRDIFLDDDPSLAAINAQLARTELVAKRKGYAIAIGHPNSSLLLALEQWLPEAERQGYTVVPVGALAR
jgi:polysaccharide deacetylase 2 family uncharacterized protein YibQ